MDHEHSVIDASTHFYVDTAKRIIRKASAKKVMIKQYDHNSERVMFEMDRRYVDGHDMSACNAVEVHYSNGGNRGMYIVDDLRVSEEDADKVICSWLISRNATQKAATIAFRLTFKCVSGEKVEYAWSTAVNNSICVSAGIDGSGAITEEYPDAIAQMQDKLDAIANTSYPVAGGLVDATVE